MEMSSSLVHQETEHHNEHPVSGQQDHRANQAVMECEQVKLWHDHLNKCPHGDDILLCTW